MTGTIDQEAWEKAAAIVDRRMAKTLDPCHHGHIDCSTEPNGPCVNEETVKEYERQVFLKRLLQEELDGDIIDITTGRYVGKARDVWS